VSKIYVLDACALIAVLSNEEGADKVVSAYNEVISGKAEIIMNAINLLEVYYGDYRVHGKETADKMVTTLKASHIKIVSEINDDIWVHPKFWGRQNSKC
jgi:PIN domain nuclease of toxin-antitoxin system